MARRFEQFTLSRWAANEQFEILIALILRNTANIERWPPFESGGCANPVPALKPRRSCRDGIGAVAGQYDTRR
nr:hypothetical protein [Rhizobium grahamii]